MSIKVSWDTPDKTVLRWTLPQKWDWDMFQDAMNQSHEMVESVDQIVDTIIDAQAGMFLPPNPLFHFRNAIETRKPNAGIDVIIGIDSMVASIYNILTQLYLPTLYLARSEAEAYKIIRKHQQERSDAA